MSWEIAIQIIAQIAVLMAFLLRIESRLTRIETDLGWLLKRRTQQRNEP